MVQPTYILLNHTGKMHDVLTIAHELGHGINNELIREKQHALDFGTPTSTAEVASTFMEDFVLEEIVHKADDELRLAIMMQKAERRCFLHLPAGGLLPVRAGAASGVQE